MIVINKSDHVLEQVEANSKRIWLSPRVQAVILLITLGSFAIAFFGFLAFISYIVLHGNGNTINQESPTFFMVGWIIIVIGMGGFFLGIITLMAMSIHDQLVAPNVGQWKSGLVGQQEVEKTLRYLDDNHYLINGLKLPQQHGDIDHLLIGPSGLFVLETKNHKGTITYQDGMWHYTKVGRGGTPYAGNIGNPVRQVQANLHILKDYLQHKDSRLGKLWWNPVVVFSHPNVVLHGTETSPVPVVKLETLPEYIAQSGKRVADQSTLQKVIEILTTS